jgi:hypothetical protein
MTEHIDDLIATMETQRNAWHDAHDQECMEMAQLGISREDMPYKPNPWARMRPLDDGLGAFRGLVNLLKFYAGIGTVALGWYALAHWHVWSRMVALLSAWRWM